MVYIAVATAWIATAAAASFAVYLTGSAWPLLIMFLPASISAITD